MIRMIQSSSAAQAKAYFSDALAQADYYLNDQEPQGQFFGKLVDRLGIGSVADRKAFFALCENRHPATGERLTPRTKEARTVGYDINFHCPKSVSILHALSKDDHILQAFQVSMLETMRDIEADAATRVRKKGAYDNRQTGELIWAEFIHQTARPLKGHPPDPHLHGHCFVSNLTYDQEEHRIKAAQFRQIKRDMPFYQAMFHKRLSDRLIEAGYRIRVTAKGFEVNGVPQRVIDLFSKRTDEIGRVAKAQGITSQKELAELGARTRGKKQKGMSMADLKAEWRRQITALGNDGQSGNPIRFGGAKETPPVDPGRYVDYALSHCFERASVKPKRRMLETACRAAIGDARVSVKDIETAFNLDRRIIKIEENGQVFCTTKEVLQEEREMVWCARKGVNTVIPLYPQTPEIKLTGQQHAAVEHVLTTGDRVSIIRGVAGAGKTTLVKEAVKLIEQTGRKVYMTAPTAQASRGVLREEGFEDADTVAGFLANREAHGNLRGQVLLVDEAGLLGTGDMKKILQLVKEHDMRLILVGDTRQHASVVRGDALRILNTVAGIRSAEVNKIYRQRDPVYRKAVADLADGKIAAGFEKLDRIGAIQAIDPMRPHDRLVKDYIDTVKKGKTALVVSPTHQQGEEVTQAIRAGLRREKMLGKKEAKVTRLNNLGRTNAEKSDWRQFETGQVIQFNQNAAGIKRGSVWRVGRIDEAGIELIGDGDRVAVLPLAFSERYDVFRQEEIRLAKGDKIRITRNSFDREEKRLNNGQTMEVSKLCKNGDIELRNPAGKATYRIGKEYGHIAHAHCITSHGSQGKTVDEIFIHQPAATFTATDAKQFYVSVSRGRDRARIYTDDKVELLHRVSEAGNRQSAVELAGKHDSQFIRIMIENPDARAERDSSQEYLSSVDRRLSYEPVI